MPAVAISTQPLASDSWLGNSSGSKIAYVAGQYRNDDIKILDTVTGTAVDVPGSDADFVSIVHFDGSSITWQASNVRPSDGEDATPGGNGHPNHWSIQRYEFASGRATTIDAGVNHWLTDDTYVHDPVVAVDGDLIAYDTEVPGPGHNVLIIVRNISTTDVVRTISVNRPVFELSLSGGDVTYVEGDIADWVLNSPDNPRMVLSRADGTKETLTIDDSIGVVEGDTTVLVDTDPWDGPIHDYAVFATQDGLTRQIGIWNESTQIAHGDGFVAWRAEFPYPEGDALVIYDTDTRQTATLVSFNEQEIGLVGWALGFRDGWFIWGTEEGDTLDPYVHSVRTDDLRDAFEALADGQ